jgi:hypothetical protein
MVNLSSAVSLQDVFSESENAFCSHPKTSCLFGSEQEKGAQLEKMK